MHQAVRPASRPSLAIRKRMLITGRSCSALSRIGGRPGDRIHVAYGYGLFTGGLGAHYGAEALGTVIPVGGGMTQRQVQLIVDFKPDIIMVTPSYLLAVADEFEAQGVVPGTSLKSGILRRTDKCHARGNRNPLRYAWCRHLWPD